jgi:hypothetical protein
VTIDAPIGMHDASRIHNAAESMAAEGLIEIDSSVSVPARERFRARLATN